MTPHGLPETGNFCLNRTGVFGDGSCPRLGEYIHCRNCPEFAAIGRTLFHREVPPEILDERTAAACTPAAGETPGTLAVIVFRLMDEWLALPAACLQEVTEKRTIHTVPGRSNKIFRGLVNINGELLLCFSALEFLRLDGDGDIQAAVCPDGERMMVLAGRGQRLVLTAGEIRGVHRILPAQLEAPPATLTRTPKAFTRGIFYWSGRPVCLLDENELSGCLLASLSGYQELHL